MSWQIVLPPSAERELDELPDRVWRDAVATLRELGEEPFPESAELLRGWRDTYRVRFADNRYRMIYRVSQQHRRLIISCSPARNSVHRLELTAFKRKPL